MRQPDRNRIFRWGAVIMALVLGAACGGGGGTGSETAVDTDGRPSLSVELVSGGFALSWTSQPEDVSELAVRTRARVDGRWVDQGGWVERSVAGVGTTYGEVEPGLRYLFRVRAPGGTWSPVVERQYARTTLPVVRLATDDGTEIRAAGRGTYRDGTFSLQPDPDGEPGMTTPAGIRGRGNSTWRYVPTKKSFQVKLSEAESLLGMARSKRWVLLANVFDRSQLRTHVAFEFARAVGPGWVPSCAWVEVIFNGDYYGIYQLCEKIEVGPDKVDIDELTAADTDPGDITGGYIVRLDGTDPDDRAMWITGASGRTVVLIRPRPGDTNDEQVAWIREFTNQVDRAVSDGDPHDPRQGHHARLDVDSFIDYWIVQELTMESDGFLTSMFAHKKRGDDKLYVGPVWDFDRSMGSEFSRYQPSPEGWLTNHPGMPDAALRTWVVDLFEDPELVDRAATRWQEVLPDLARVTESIAGVAPTLDEAKVADRLRWADEVDTKWGIRYGDVDESDETGFIVDWLRQRIAWITANLAGFDSTTDPGPRVELMPDYPS